MTHFDFPAMRAAMIAGQLRTNAVTDARLLAALEAVARERFVSEGKSGLAYADVPVPLTSDRALNDPLATARLIQEVQAEAGDRVLLVGAATGYAAALLAAMGVRITALEDDTLLAEQARTNLTNEQAVVLVESPLAEGAAQYAPFDAVIIDGAVERVPDALWAQLREGGSLVAGLISGHVTQLVHGVKHGTSQQLRPFLDCDAAVLPGFACAREFVF